MSASLPSQNSARLLSVLKDGIGGALALNCIWVALLSAGLMANVHPVSDAYYSVSARYSIQGLIIGVGCLGFVLGLAIRRYFPGALKAITALGAAGFPVTALGWLLLSYADHVECYRRVKLADCSGTGARAQFTAPDGYEYSLRLAAPSPESAAFSGHLEISDGKSVITNYPIETSHLKQRCEILRASKKYEINVIFDQPPPQPTSIWLWWKEGYTNRHGWHG